MTSQPSNIALQSLWQQLVDAEFRFYAARMALFREVKGEADLIGLLRTALAHPGERGTALRLLADNEQLQRALFSELVELASATPAGLELVRSIILSMEREWIAERLPEEIDKVLLRLHGEDAAEGYSRFAEILRDLKSPYFATLKLRAAASSDPEVRAVSGYL